MSWIPTTSPRRPRTAQACILWDGAVVLENYHYLPEIEDRFFGTWPEIWCSEEGKDLPFKAVSHWRSARGA